MVIFGILIIVGGLLALCWLCFNTAVYALPIGVAILAGRACLDHHLGWPAAIGVAFIAGVLTLAGGNLALAFGRHPGFITLIALAFMTPAAVVGYYTAHGLLGLMTMPDWVLTALSLLAGTITGITAICRVVTLGRTSGGETGASVGV